MQPTLLETARKAQELFHRNMDTLVAGFLIRHPDIDPGDIELVFQPTTEGVLRFSIAAKELHVPEAKVRKEGDGSGDLSYIDGWNECRQAMIDQAKAANHAEGNTTRKLGDQHVV